MLYVLQLRDFYYNFLLFQVPVSHDKYGQDLKTLDMAIHSCMCVCCGSGDEAERFTFSAHKKSNRDVFKLAVVYSHDKPYDRRACYR